MTVNLKVPEYEMEVVIEALKMAAIHYGAARVAAFTVGDSDGYLNYQEKKNLTWETYSHFKQALEREKERATGEK